MSSALGKDYGKFKIGGIERNQALIFKAEAPLDDRSVVVDKGGLLAKSSFGDTSGGTSWMYIGMTTTVQSTGEIYVLRQKPAELLTDAAIDSLYANGTLDSTIALYWNKIAKASDVQALAETVSQNMQTLSGVFQFKGVADSIDEDFTVITIKPLTYNDKSYVCTGFYYDLMMTKYYKWESSDSEASPRILFTKDGDATNSIYLFSNDGNERQAIYVEHNGETFYFDFTHNGSTDGVLKFTSLLGNTIYADSNLGLDDIRANNYVPSSTKFYSSATTQTDSGDGATLLFTATPVVYAAYEFVIYGNPAYTGTLGSGEKVFASSKTDDPNNPYNVGHVYQIGEKEYASNGLIWVELGSPKEEIAWLVINS